MKSKLLTLVGTLVALATSATALTLILTRTLPTLGWILLTLKALALLSTIAALLRAPRPASRLLAYRYRFDTRTPHGLSQALTRFSWETLQTESGYIFGQLRLACRLANRVEHYGGITYVVNQHAPRPWGGVSLGAIVNIAVSGTLADNFPHSMEALSTSQPHSANTELCRHEYGHTYDSQLSGPLYLLCIGLPSLLSLATATPSRPHQTFYTERRADRWAARHFQKQPTKPQRVIKNSPKLNKKC